MTVYTGLVDEPTDVFDLHLPPYAREVRRG